MTPVTVDADLFADELLMAIGVHFQQFVDTSEPRPDENAHDVIDKALDELVGNAVALKAVGTNIAGVVALNVMARDAIGLRRAVNEAVVAGTSQATDFGWAVAITLTDDGKVREIQLHRQVVSLTERFG